MKRKIFIKCILFAAIFLIVFTVGFVFFRNQFSENKTVSDYSINFTLQSVYLEDIVLSDIKSDYFLINFWAVSCPYCIEQIKELVYIDKNYPDSKISIIGINLDRNKTAVLKTMGKYGISYPVVFADRKVIGKFPGITGVPVSFLLNSKRGIIKKYIGLTFAEDIKSDIK